MAAVSMSANTRNKLLTLFSQGYNGFGIGDLIYVGLIQDTASVSTITSQNSVINLSEQDLRGGYSPIVTTTHAYPVVSLSTSQIASISGGVITYNPVTFTATSGYDQNIKIYGYYILSYNLTNRTIGYSSPVAGYRNFSIFTPPSTYTYYPYVPLVVMYDPLSPTPFTTGTVYTVTPKISFI